MIFYTAIRRREVTVYNNNTVAGVAELADAADLKSAGDKTPCGFESHLPHWPAIIAGFFYITEKAAGYVVE